MWAVKAQFFLVALLSAVVAWVSDPDLLAVARAGSVLALPLLRSGSDDLDARDEALPAGPVVAVPLDLQPDWLIITVNPDSSANPARRWEKIVSETMAEDPPRCASIPHGHGSEGSSAKT